MKNKSYLNAHDVAECLGVSLPQAYKIIRRLNNELVARGTLVVVGQISRTYFEQRIYGGTCA